jgi:hypothetical protein
MLVCLWVSANCSTASNKISADKNLGNPYTSHATAGIAKDFTPFSFAILRQFNIPDLSYSCSFL